MKESSKYKRFKRFYFSGYTFTLPTRRSSIIRTIRRYIHYPNMPDLRRFEKQAQINKIQPTKTNKLLSVCDRALLTLSYYDMIIRSDSFIMRARGVKKLKTYLIFEMLPILVYYSYEQKYHKLTSMNIHSYQCLNVYIVIEKGTLMNKDIQ